MIRRFALWTALLALTAVVSTARAQDASSIEVWTGSATLPGGAELGFSINLKRTDPHEATIDIPAQGAIGIPLEVVSIEGDSIILRIPAPANAEIAGTLNDQGELAGMLKQAGIEFPFKLERSLDAPAGPNRPQMPTPPYPYEVEDLVFDNDAAGVTLAGTLTIPAGEGPFPAAVLVSGSGPQDRNETLVGHKPFLVLADHLTRAGIAVLRYDERGVFESTGDFASATTDDFASDALAAFTFLKSDPRIDPSRIGIIGHSEGGTIAPMVAASDTSVAYIVLLAGTAVDGGEILRTQQVALTRAAGAPESVLQEINNQMALVVDGIRAGGNHEAVAPPLRAVLAAQSPGATDAGIDQALAQQLGFFTSPWMVRFVQLDPADALSRITQPTLALFGDLDLQVLSALNAEPMHKALELAPTEDVTIITMPGLNHLFQQATTGAGTEYAQIEETFNPNALKLVSSWITQRFAH